MRHVILSIMAVIISGCATSKDSPTESLEVIAPGVLNLPVLPGHFVPDNCEYTLGELPDPALLGCVAFPLELAANSETPFEWLYISELEKSGWAFADGLANVLFVERPVNDGECKQRMALVAWLLGDAEEIDKYGTMAEPEMDWEKVPYQVIWFVMDDENSCLK